MERVSAGSLNMSNKIIIFEKYVNFVCAYVLLHIHESPSKIIIIIKDIDSIQTRS